MAIAHQSGDRELEANCLDTLGVVAMLQGDFPAANNYLRECHTISMAIDDHWMAAGALTNLGNISMMQGDYEEANSLVQ